MSEKKNDEVPSCEDISDRILYLLFSIGADTKGMTFFSYYGLGNNTTHIEILFPESAPEESDRYVHVEITIFKEVENIPGVFEVKKQYKIPIACLTSLDARIFAGSVMMRVLVGVKRSNERFSIGEYMETGRKVKIPFASTIQMIPTKVEDSSSSEVEDVD